MNLTWLEDFLALSATGNFSRAAQQRHLTQPAFSRRIKALEDWLGTPLFDRTSNPTMLTPTGLWFGDVAKQILTQASQLPEQAQAVAASRSDTLRFAATHSLSLTFLPKWLRSLESSLQIGPIQLVSDVLAQCEALLLQNKVQFLLCHTHDRSFAHLDSSSHTSVVVGADMLVPVKAPLPSCHGLVLDQPSARRIPLLQYSTESGLARIFRSTRASSLEKLATETVFTAHLATVLKTMALEGRGIAWLPRSLIDEDLSAGRLVNAGSEKWHINLEIRLFRKRKLEPDAAEAFWLAAGGVKMDQS
jgi:DNA-binding transcriptional LysR family regulator